MDIGITSVRTYDKREPVMVSGDSLMPQSGEFLFPAEAWVRLWVLVDFDNQEFSYWLWSEGSGLVQIHDRVFHHLDETLQSFWFEFNSSQVREGGDEIYIWGRNLVMLQDVAGYDEALQLVTMGAP